MKVLVLGSDGFLGGNTTKSLINKHEVLTSSRGAKGNGTLSIDLLDEVSVRTALEKSQPDAVINCAGVVENNEKAYANVTFTRNLLHAVTASKIVLKRIVIIGSAAEYGIVGEAGLPVPETAPVSPVGEYANAKAEETAISLKYKNDYGLPIVVARVFNPIGPGMHQRFLLPSLQRQIRGLKAGKNDHIELSRLESSRDYIDVRDVGDALAALLEGQLEFGVYNVGSGVRTTNKEIVRLLLELNGLPENVTVVETAMQPEPFFACQADIKRVCNDTGWYPKFSLRETIEGVINEKNSD